ncbi:Gfo/Idh/MocA family protein [Paenibacillus hodogayensis]|uniref:Gfo/Idh/MocA family protein n=1 Tax=Paenibacillus hodogayensis TaxID=279208 RepID=A0ABV5W6P6_9BACL
MTESRQLRIGMIGLDTSHCEAFAKLLNDEQGEHHIPGARLTAAFPAGSPDMEMSISRVGKFSDSLREQYGVRIVDSVAELAEQTDGILLTSVDGRVHLEQFCQLLPYKLPVFVDKPFATASADAERMLRLAEDHGIPLMTCSMLRYAEELTEALKMPDRGKVTGIDCYGPFYLEETAPGLFWYGIHCVEMLYRAFGAGCSHVTATTRGDHDIIVAEWKDGRLATLRGNRAGNTRFGAVVHHEKNSLPIDPRRGRPMNAVLMEAILDMFRTGVSPIDPAESLEIIRFIEAANESRGHGRTVSL